MAMSKYSVNQYATQFVESGGAILFRMATKQVCLNYYSSRVNCYYLRAAVTAENQDMTLRCVKPEKRQATIAISTLSLW